MWRWLRNKGFAFTAEQRLDRWDDIGGPKRFERWTLQSRLRFLVGRLLVGLWGVVGVLTAAWLLDAPARATAGLVAGFLLGTVIGLVVAGNRLWDRDRRLYARWLRMQERRQAALGAAT